jgi:hypothetical protein
MLKTRVLAGVFAVLACLMSSTATAQTASPNPLVAAIGFAMFCSGVWLARTPRV